MVEANDVQRRDRQVLVRATIALATREKRTRDDLLSESITTTIPRTTKWFKL